MNNNNDGKGNRNINLDKGNYNEKIGGDYNDNRQYHNYPSEKPFKLIKCIPKLGSANFVGRKDELAKVHQELYEQNNRVAISAVSGMGGVGKTELAIQYANQYENDYPGGICWLNVRDGNLAEEIIQFVQQRMELEVPQKDFQGNALTVEQQVAWCWQNWQPPFGLVLVVLDDVAEYKDVKKLLPRTDNKRFKLLITTRQRRLDSNFFDIPLNLLSEDESLSLLRGILAEEAGRIDRELQTAKDLCKWLGYLPLGLELVGRYLLEDPDLSIATMLEKLKQERLGQEAINLDSEELEDTEMTAKLGIKAAFNLTWERLDSKTKEVGELLSLFDPNAIAWKYVDSVSESLNWGKKDVNEGKNQLYKRHLIEKLEEGEGEPNYQIHPLIHEFLGSKFQASTQIQELEQAFTSTFIEIAKTTPNTKLTTLEFVNSVKNAIPHLIEVAEQHLDAVSNENLYSVFMGLGYFYREQGLYALAEPWYQQYVELVKSRLGENHPDYATNLAIGSKRLAGLYESQGKYEEAESFATQALELTKRLFGENNIVHATGLNDFASIYWKQGKYEEAESFATQALELRKRLLGENHPDYVASLNNLAVVYKLQGKYEEAESLVTQVLELTKRLLGENHPYYATSLSNLAFFYSNQGKYEEAESLYLQALELRKHLFGENHPKYATSLNDFANLYWKQGKYEKAESLVTQVLELTKRFLGENHPDYAASLNSLALVYSDQGKYEQAESLYLQALKLRKRLLGENHPDYATNLNNLAAFYFDQEKYEQAESLYLQALKIIKRLLGENHPDYATSLNNLASLYWKQKKYEQAEPLFIQAFELIERILGANHPDFAASLNNLALFYADQRKLKL